MVQIKYLFPMQSTQKAALASAAEAIYSTQCKSDPQWARAVHTLLSILTAIVHHPQEHKYRKLRTDVATVHNHIIGVSAILNFCTILGFSFTIPDRQYFELPDQVSLECVQDALDLLQHCEAHSMQTQVRNEDTAVRETLSLLRRKHRHLKEQEAERRNLLDKIHSAHHPHDRDGVGADEGRT